MLKKLLFKCSICSLWACFPLVLFPQLVVVDTITLEPVSISQSKVAIRSLPGSKVQALDSTVMRDKASLSLSELLIENSPVFIKTFGKGALSTASFRGTSASHTQVFWNGMKINSPMSGQVDFSQIPILFVDEVNILFGQSSMGYASGGLGGAISLQSSPGWNRNTGIKFTQSIGSFQSFLTGLSASYAKGKITGQTRLLRESSENNFAYVNRAKLGHPIERQTNADYTTLGLLQEISFRPSTSHVLSLKLWVHDNNRGIPQIMSNSPTREHNRQGHLNTNALLGWNAYANRSKWSASIGFSSLNFNYNFYKISAQNDTSSIADVLSLSRSLHARVDGSLFLTSWLTLELQGRIEHDGVNSTDHFLSTGYKKSIRTVALLNTLVAKPNEHLGISLLVWEELHGNVFSPIMPSLSAEYSLPFHSNLRLKGALGRNYHYPSLNDLYFQPGGNSELKPEAGYSYEGGAAYKLSQGPYASEFNLTLFRSDIQNWIMWLPHLKGFWEPVNIDRVRAQGAELSLMAKMVKERGEIKVMGQYSYTRSSVQNTGGAISSLWENRQLPFIPIHSGGIVVSVRFSSLSAIYTFTHFSERFTTMRSNTNSYRRLYPYFMSALSLGKTFAIYGKKLDLQFRVDNLLDESYQTMLWRPMPGRNFNLLVNFQL